MWRWLLISLGALAGACGDGELDPPDAGPDAGPVDVVDDFLDVGCSTAVVLGLSLEIADELACMDADALAVFEASSDIVFSTTAVLPYLSPAAIEDLEAGVAAGITSVGAPLQINSSFRTVAQQYLLYQWFLRGRCGITAAATPGRSNHESGRTIDVQNFAAWAGALSSAGWAQNVPGDEVHFEHLASADNRGLDVMAFQSLWNRARPGDEITADGIFGPATEARMKIAPADGFGLESCPTALSPKREAALGVVVPERAESISCDI